MKFRKIAPVLFSIAFSFSSAMFPLPAHAAAHNGSGTASVNVTVTARNVDNGGTGGQKPDNGGAGDKIPGGAGGQKPGSSGGDDVKPGQGDGDSTADTDKDKHKDKDKSKDKEKCKDKDKSKDKDKDKGSDGSEKNEGDKGADDGNGDSGKGICGKPDKKNPSGHPAILPSLGYPAGRTSDSNPDTEKGLDDKGHSSVGDAGALNDTSGSKNGQEPEDTGGSESADAKTDGPSSDGSESGGTGDSGSEMNGFVKMLLQYWKQAVLAVLVFAASVLAAFYARRRIRFHGILADKDIDGVLFRRNMDSANGAAIVPELIGKLNGGVISFEEYEDQVMESKDVTLLPAGTKMYISVTDAGMAETWPAEKADESRMFGRLEEAALLAQMKGRMVMADIVLKHERKGIEIPLHFVFR